MPPYLQRSKPVIPSTRGAQEQVEVKFGGLDLSSPYDEIERGRTPDAQNFRLYAEEANDRRVAVTSRKGSGRYLDPIGEAITDSEENTVGSADQALSFTTWLAQPFTATATGPLTKVALSLKRDSSAIGPVVVEIYDDNAGAPGTLLTSSGVINSDLSSAYAMLFARNVEAPQVTSGSTYWIVAHLQDDNVGNFYWKSTTGASEALISQTSGQLWSTAGFSLLFRAYVSNSGTVKGMARFTPSGGANRTILAVGDKLYQGTDGTNSLAQVVTGLNAAAEEYSFAFGDNKLFFANRYDDLKALNPDGTVDTITHSQLPTLRLICFHKNVLWGIDADDDNKLVYSVGPVEQDALGNQWYRGWRSTNFGYIPAPKAADPITYIGSFQDTLVVATATTKWNIHGSNPGDISPRESTGKKGIVSQRGGFADENFLYFVGTDGFYRYNGSEDILISERVQPEFDAIADLNKVVITKYKRQIRFYYPSAGSSYNNRCLIWHTVFEEWMLDTDSCVSFAVPWTDADDPKFLAEASSTAPAVYLAEQDTNNLGREIKYYYDCKYDSFGNPAKKKRLPRLIPLLEGSGSDYKVQVGIDKDRQNTPAYIDYPLSTTGAKIGQFTFGDGTKLGTTANYRPRKVRASGYAYYWQLRIKRFGIDNPVKFIGYSLSYREKKL